MPTNKNAQLRYKILDECFANRYKTFGIQDLIEVCSDRLSEYYGEEIRISRRTIYEDIRFMESADGFDAPITHIKEGKNVYFRYEDPHFSILKKELSAPEKEVITNALSIFARIKKLQGFEGIEEVATKIQTVLDIDYQEQIIDFQDNEYLKGTELKRFPFLPITSSSITIVGFSWATMPLRIGWKPLPWIESKNYR